MKTVFLTDPRKPLRKSKELLNLLLNKVKERKRTSSIPEKMHISPQALLRREHSLQIARFMSIFVKRNPEPG